MGVKENMEYTGLIERVNFNAPIRDGARAIPVVGETETKECGFRG